jgi:hypothetical protein
MDRTILMQHQRLSPLCRFSQRLMYLGSSVLLSLSQLDYFLGFIFGYCERYDSPDMSRGSETRSPEVLMLCSSEAAVRGLVDKARVTWTYAIVTRLRIWNR